MDEKQMLELILNKLTQSENEFKEFKQEFNEFKQETNRKLDVLYDSAMESKEFQTEMRQFQVEANRKFDVLYDSAMESKEFQAHTIERLENIESKLNNLTIEVANSDNKIIQINKQLRLAK